MTSEIRLKKTVKSEQVGFKVEPDVFLALQAAAARAKRRTGELARLLFEWAFHEYEEAGSYDALMRRGTIASSAHDTDPAHETNHALHVPEIVQALSLPEEELQKQLRTDLRLVLEQGSPEERSDLAVAILASGQRVRNETSTKVPGTIDEKSYREALRKQVLTTSKRVELAEKVGREQGRRPRSKQTDEQEKAATQTDRTRTSSG